MSNSKQRGLKRGISAMIADIDLPSEAVAGEAQSSGENLPIEWLNSNPDQPRKYFDEEELEGLADSIRVKGIVQPILVRKIANENYQIVAGERRWRAAQRANLHQVPVIIREYTDEEVEEIALLENVQRKDLTAIEEAKGYKALMEHYHHTQEALSKVMGKSRSHLANLMRLLTLPEYIQESIQADKIQMGHARALIGIDESKAIEICKKIENNGLSVRQVEALVKNLSTGNAAKPTANKPVKSADIKNLELELSAALSMNVQIGFDGKGGNVKIAYQSLDDLDRLCALLGK